MPRSTFVPRTAAAIGSVAIAFGASSACRQSGAAPQTVAVTPDQIAAAMKKDEFYATYGGKMLRVHGKVASASRAGNVAEVFFETTFGPVLRCTVSASATAPVAGDSAAVTATSASRRGDTTVLDNCRLGGQ